MACFSRSGDDNFARALHNQGLLDFYALGTRRGARGIPPENTRLKPVFGMANFLLAKTLSTYRAESLRFRLYGQFDRWAQRLLRPEHHFFTGYAFAPGAMNQARANGGLAIMDAWTSHPAEFWNLLSEEQKLWDSPFPPVSAYYQRKVCESVAAADYICVASNFVRQSFLKHGYPAAKLWVCPYPVDLEAFKPAPAPRPANRPFTILHNGGLSLRKGAPYLFEAFRLIRKEIPNAVLRVKRSLRDDVTHLLPRYRDIPVEWSDGLSFEDHVRRYQTSDLLLFPSVEDGFALVVAEALACGLPVVTTVNTGAADLIQPGVNGDVVPIRDAPALAQAALRWWEKLRHGGPLTGREALIERLNPQRFERNFIQNLATAGVALSPA